MDNRPYPRKELCPCCQKAKVDVIGPGDTWAMCVPCHLELAEEARGIGDDLDLIRCGTMDPDVMRHVAALMEDPTMSDDVFADVILDRRGASG